MVGERGIRTSDPLVPNQVLVAPAGEIESRPEELPEKSAEAVVALTTRSLLEKPNPTQAHNSGAVFAS